MTITHLEGGCMEKKYPKFGRKRNKKAIPLF